MTYNSNAYSAKKQKKAETDSPENLLDPVKVEWVQVAPNKIVVATAEKTYLVDLNTDKCSTLHKFLRDRPTNLIEGTDNIATTRKLLDGAIAAAKYAVNSDVRPPALTATRWVWRLAGQYYLTHAYPPLIEKAAMGFAAFGHTRLAEWALQKADEERGHDRLALLDIKSMGYDVEAVVEAVVPPPAVTLVDYLTRSAQDDDPIDCVGYSYTLERLSTGMVDEKYIQQVKMLLSSNTHATRCLRVHSSVGHDAEHVEETVEMVAELTPQERVRVARACYETALLCFSPPSEGYISDEELQQILKPLKLGKSL